MYINIEEINKDDFNISERIWNNHLYYLVGPKKSKHEWVDNELHLRSLLLDESGQIVSSSFPKFFNYSERPSDIQKFHNYLKSGNVKFPEKMDGSLIIRSIIKGCVNFRTRGSHILADGFEVPVMSLVKEKYPALLDSNLFTGKSLLFEYTSPDNRIVLEYSEAKLTSLGWMNLYDDKLPDFEGTISASQEISSLTGVEAVSFSDLSYEINSLKDEVSGWRGREGVVAWCDNGAFLVKIKAEEYLKIHRLKYQMTEDRVRKMAWFGNWTSIEDMKKHFYKRGLDWETINFVIPLMEKYFVDKAQVEQEFVSLQKLIFENKIDSLPTKGRQADAIKHLSLHDKTLAALGFKILNNDSHAISKWIAAKILQIPINALVYAEHEAKLYLGDEE